MDENTGPENTGPRLPVAPHAGVKSVGTHEGDASQGGQDND
jgi:hypothetical protein